MLLEQVLRWLINNYADDYLDKKVLSDNFEFDLLQQHVVIRDQALKTAKLNEKAAEFNLPFEFVDSYFDKIEIKFSFTPKTTLAAHFKGLKICIQPKARMAVNMGTSMFDSTMKSSTDLAKKFCETPDGYNQGMDTVRTCIENVFGQSKVQFTDTIIKLQYCPPESKTGVGFQVRIADIQFNFESAVPEESGSVPDNTHIYRRIQMTGVEFFTDEFFQDVLSKSMNSSPDSKKSSDSTCSSTSSSFDTGGHSIPVLVAKLFGSHVIELTAKVQQDKNVCVPGPSLIVECEFGFLMSYMTPRQVHLLWELCKGFMMPPTDPLVETGSHLKSKPMDNSDYRKLDTAVLEQFRVEQRGSAGGLMNCKGWSSPMEDEDEFLPMTRNGQRTSCVTDCYSEIDMDTSFVSTVSAVSMANSTVTSRTSAANVPRSRDKSRGAESSARENIAFKFNLGTFGVVLLHDDILSVSESTSQIYGASVYEMSNLAKNFLKTFSENEKFETYRTKMENECGKSHIRLLACPVTFEYSDKELSVTYDQLVNLTVGQFEIVECAHPCGDKDSTNPQPFVNLNILKFNERNSDDAQIGLKNDLRLEMYCTEKTSCHGSSRKTTQSSVTCKLLLQPCQSEIDISISDRIFDLLEKRIFASDDEHADSVPASSNLKFSAECPSFQTRVRFPVPDLREPVDRMHWYKRNIRPDILTVEFKNVKYEMGTGRDSVSWHHVICRDICCYYQNCEAATPILFMYTSLEDEVTHFDHAGFGYPRISIKTCPKQPQTPFNDHMDSDSEDDHEFYMKVKPRGQTPFAPSPFIHASTIPSHILEPMEKMNTPADKKDMKEFMDDSRASCELDVDFQLPTVHVVLENRQFLEKLYNLIGNDLILWTPSATHSSMKNLQSSCLAEGLDFYASACPTFKEMNAVGHDDDSDDDHEYSHVGYPHKDFVDKKEKSLSKGQSKMSISVKVAKANIAINTPLMIDGKTKMPGHHGELVIQLQDANLFIVDDCRGTSGLSYVCLQSNKCSLWHAGLQSDYSGSPRFFEEHKILSHLLPTLTKSSPLILGSLFSTIGNGEYSQDMLSLAIEIQRDEDTRTKSFVISSLVNGATLTYRMMPSIEHWFYQIQSFFDISDEPVAGYVPYSTVKKLHINFKNSAVEYKTPKLPHMYVLKLESFYFSSNIAERSTVVAKPDSDVLRFIFDSATLLASNANGEPNYISLVHVDMFEIIKRYNSEDVQMPCSKRCHPKYETVLSNNYIDLWTCADSFKCLVDFVKHIACQGDLMQDTVEPEEDISASSALVSVNTTSAPSLIPSVTDMQQEMVEKGIISAIDDTDDKQTDMKVEAAAKYKQKKEEVFYFPGETHPSAQAHGHSSAGNFSEDEEEEFLFIENEPGSGLQSPDGRPLFVRYPTSEGYSCLPDTKYYEAIEKNALLAPDFFPNPISRLLVYQLSIRWFVFGGTDFKACETAKKRGDDQHCSGPPSASSSPTNYRPASRASRSCSISDMSLYSWTSGGQHAKSRAKQPGGPGRNTSSWMECYITKLQYQKEDYPEMGIYAKREVIQVKDIEIVDQMSTSKIQKFLYGLATPQQRQADPSIFQMKILTMGPSSVEPGKKDLCVKVTVLPLRLNVDQDSLGFLNAFYKNLTMSQSKNSNFTEDTLTQTHSNQDSMPVMMVDSPSQQNASNDALQSSLLMQFDDENTKQAVVQTKEKEPDSSSATDTVYYIKFDLTPAVLIKIDYVGKHLDWTDGPLNAVMKAGSVTDLQLRLKSVSLPSGKRDFISIWHHLVTVWKDDIKTNQMNNIIGSLGALHPCCVFLSGICDLVVLPYNQYKKDRRFMAGLTRGVNSFGTSTILATVDTVMAGMSLVQNAAEFAHNIVSSGPSLDNQCYESPPRDMRQAVQQSAKEVTKDIQTTFKNVVHSVTSEHEQKGWAGAVGGFVRSAPAVTLMPLRILPKGVNKILQGVRNQVDPDKHFEENNKWRQPEQEDE